MKPILPLLAALSTLPISAQGTERAWIFGVHQFGPTFEAGYQGTQDGKPVSFNSKSDLALEKDKTGFGGILEYQGPRFGLELSGTSQDFKGSNTITRKITIDGQDYNVGAKVESTLALKVVSLNWTIRFLKFDHAWLGIDLGARALEVDLKTSGYDPFSGVTAKAAFKAPAPIPQIGASAGFQAFGNRFTVRGYYHLLNYKEATYKHFGADARVYPLKWLGLRAFVNNETVDVPKGTLESDKDMALKIDLSGVGFGVIVRL